MTNHGGTLLQGSRVESGLVQFRRVDLKGRLRNIVVVDQAMVTVFYKDDNDKLLPSVSVTAEGSQDVFVTFDSGEMLKIPITPALLLFLREATSPIRGP